jgi:hypothetical protein
MTDTEGAQLTASHKRRRIITVAIGVATIIGAATTFYFYKRYAEVWLRSPPRMPACVLLTRRMLAHEETVSGSIPHMGPDGTMVYLRPNEDRAVRCMGRLSGPTAAHLAAAFAEVDPDKRARALAAILRDHISTQTSADAEALAAYFITTAALRALPKTEEIDKLREEAEQRTSCRFAMPRSKCPSRPPIPMPVWIFGGPSAVGLVVSLGWGAKSIGARVRAWRQKRRKSTKSPEKTSENSETIKSE